MKAELGGESTRQPTASVGACFQRALSTKKKVDDIDFANPQGGSGDDEGMPGLVD
tara:strand:- start:234 stop:398 length:165 start_codon:yes stop_codon:yes gene_type:complete